VHDRLFQRRAHRSCLTQFKATLFLDAVLVRVLSEIVRPFASVYPDVLFPHTCVAPTGAAPTVDWSRVLASVMAAMPPSSVCVCVCVCVCV
jgi:hypothetical protein